eukprot:PhM_4_TR2437/c6_g1_i1/m.50774
MTVAATAAGERTDPLCEANAAPVGDDVSADVDDPMDVLKDDMRVARRRSFLACSLRRLAASTPATLVSFSRISRMRCASSVWRHTSLVRTYAVPSRKTTSRSRPALAVAAFPVASSCDACACCFSFAANCSNAYRRRSSLLMAAAVEGLEGSDVVLLATMVGFGRFVGVAARGACTELGRVVAAIAVCGRVGIMFGVAARLLLLLPPENNAATSERIASMTNGLSFENVSFVRCCITLMSTLERVVSSSSDVSSSSSSTVWTDDDGGGKLGASWSSASLCCCSSSFSVSFSLSSLTTSECWYRILGDGSIKWPSGVRSLTPRILDVDGGGTGWRATDAYTLCRRTLSALSSCRNFSCAAERTSAVISSKKSNVEGSSSSYRTRLRLTKSAVSNGSSSSFVALRRTALSAMRDLKASFPSPLFSFFMAFFCVRKLRLVPRSVK